MALKPMVPSIVLVLDHVLTWFPSLHTFEGLLSCACKGQIEVLGNGCM